MVRPTTPKERMEYGKRVRAAREAKKMLKASVASAMGQPVWMIEKLEIGEPIIWSPNHYKKLESILGLTSSSSPKPLEPAVPSSSG